MEFIKIAKSGIEGTAEVPETALPHWLSYGWYRVDQAPAEQPVIELPADQPPTTTAPTRASRRAPNAGTTEE